MTEDNRSFQMLVETQELLKAASKLEPGQTLPNGDIRQITGRTKEKCVGICKTVCDRILKDHGRTVVYHPARLGGLRCLTAAETIEYAQGGVQAIGKKAKRTGRVAASAPDEKLEDTERLQKHGIGTICKLFQAVHRKQKEVAAITGPDEPLRIGDAMLKLFQK